MTGAPTEQQKAVANICARFALKGFAVHKTTSGAWLVCRWNQSCHCPDLGALQAFARQVGIYSEEVHHAG
ncbi:hypothetical protein C6568_04120 [Melaminivora suipulveris]|uniref:Uncharacterized protein n=1 Tax=Melaminivora suipulveris TaxID=2109913 RepID=A0A2R3Q9S5_9BURK|nr:hypothetical protein [Melaminivora suipulveris]AVO48542.1 hypothetical protein C6568_04120 [Melaminivora suipulveris]